MTDRRANELWLMMGVVALSYPELQWVAGVSFGILEVSLSLVNEMGCVESRFWTITELESRTYAFGFHDELVGMARRLRIREGL
jgi:hypothetical protein